MHKNSTHFIVNLHCSSGSQFMPLVSGTLSVLYVLKRVFENILSVPRQSIALTVSSRTDSGVHALQNTCLLRIPVDFEMESEQFVADLSSTANGILDSLKTDIRVQSIIPVVHGFHFRRHVLWRSYLYRLAVLKQPSAANVPSSDNDILWRYPIPIAEVNRSWAVGPNFDTVAFADAGRAFLGEHNMDSFHARVIPKENVPVPDPVRTILDVSIEIGSPLISPALDPLCNRYDYYEVTITARSFLYQQIRRMVGAMVAVASRRASVDNIQWLLEHPSPENWSQFGWPLAPPHGLYLKTVTYNPRDFLNPAPCYKSLCPSFAGEVELGDQEEDVEIDDEELLAEPEQEENENQLELGLRNSHKPIA